MVFLGLMLGNVWIVVVYLEAENGLLFHRFDLSDDQLKLVHSWYYLHEHVVKQNNELTEFVSVTVNIFRAGLFYTQLETDLIFVTLRLVDCIDLVF